MKSANIEASERSSAVDQSRPLHVRTPLLESLPLSQIYGQRVYIKMDNVQPSGSFKIRGMGILCQDQEVHMLQARLVSKDDAKLRCTCGVRQYDSNKEAEAYNTLDTVEDVDAIYEADSENTIVGYRSDAYYESAKRRLHSLSTAEVICGGACAVETSHGFIVASAYISPGSSLNDIQTDEWTLTQMDGQTDGRMLE
ncbi:hypothetical protein HPB51_012337 [Rhipicephalus microplus]|uniref:L-serine ammonia-lyase n=1 Tax=Rhipicephalus microplus TaxID=6941 RepID=A0A9J6DG13_RHIMP|nr:hypothetical protein HPB51_012337 [Rhipicephalus microplus]